LRELSGASYCAGETKAVALRNVSQRRIAYFDGEPGAQAAAQVLQELGFTAVVHRCTDEPYAATIRKFFDGEIRNFEINAVVESDADPESFETVILRHHGRPARGV
jgi:hypothetical protein